MQARVEFGGLRDDNMGVQKNGLSEHELNPVVLVLIFGGIMLKEVNT